MQESVAHGASNFSLDPEKTSMPRARDMQVVWEV